jgi:DNA-binding response OmpR family regulator
VLLHGHWVKTCAEARDALAESPHDVILLDLGLPDGDGIDLLRRGAPRIQRGRC